MMRNIVCIEIVGSYIKLTILVPLIINEFYVLTTRLYILCVVDEFFISIGSRKTRNIHYFLFS